MLPLMLFLSYIWRHDQWATRETERSCQGTENEGKIAHVCGELIFLFYGNLGWYLIENKFACSCWNCNQWSSVDKLIINFLGVQSWKYIDWSSSVLLLHNIQDMDAWRHGRQFSNDTFRSMFFFNDVCVKIRFVYNKTLFLIFQLKIIYRWCR